MFKKIDRKWQKVIKEDRKRPIHLDIDNKVVKETKKYTIINWLDFLYVFPTLNNFKLSNLPNGDEYPKISVCVKSSQPPILKIYDPGNLFEIGVLSYGIELGHRFVDLDKLDIKNRIMIESI